MNSKNFFLSFIKTKFSHIHVLKVEIFLVFGIYGNLKKGNI